MKKMILLLLISEASFGSSLSLSNYLQMVGSEHSSIESSNKMIESSGAGKAQSSLVNSPRFFMEARTTEDKSPTLLGELQGTYRKNQSFATGFSFQSELGFDARAYVSGDKQGTFGSSFIESGKEEVYFQGSNLELSIPLWQGFLGKSLELEKSKILSQSVAENANAKYQKQQLLVEAELSYLRLAKLQNEIEILRELVKQGERLAAYAEKKVGQRLLEVTNLKESQAALSARQLQFESKLAEKSDATKEFLSFIQANNLQDQYEVERLDSIFEGMRTQERIPSRLDIKVQASALEVDRAQLLEATESLKPKLELTSRYSSFNQQSNFNDSRRCISQNDCSILSFGVFFEIPLELNNLSEVRSAISNRLRARELMLHRAKYDSKAEFDRLVNQIDLGRKRLSFSEDLVKIQKQRLQEERRRQNFGRGSTFDVIRAEQDHSQSLLSDIEIKHFLLESNARLKLFEEKQL